mmetsp:Transcript_25112/g.26937  ORF Transcript_25112/g.26937 Transcript_25112/m.26937 type:complete len:255 (-) Transcript_25112:586-1350(-)
MICLINFITVAIFFTGINYRIFILSHLLVYRRIDDLQRDKWEGPIKKNVAPMAKMIIIPNKSVTMDIAAGATCDDFYPITCDDSSNSTKSTCSQVEVIACDKSIDSCPAFFQVDATLRDDQISRYCRVHFGINYSLYLLICHGDGTLLTTFIRFNHSSFVRSILYLLFAIVVRSFVVVFKIKVFSHQIILCIHQQRKHNKSYHIISYHITTDHIIATVHPPTDTTIIRSKQSIYNTMHTQYISIQVQIQSTSIF